MIRHIMCFLFLSLIVSLFSPESHAQNALRNPGFETFVNGEPAGWTTSNIPGVLVLVSQAREAHSGKSGVKLEVKSFYGTKMAGTLTQEEIPITARQVRFSGYYMLSSTGGDKTNINVTLINENGSSICVENLNLDPSASFKQFTLPLSAPEASVVARAKVCIAIIGGDNDQLHEGTRAIFDDCVLTPLAAENDVHDRDR